MDIKKAERHINFYVREDGKIVITIYAYGIPISRSTLNEGWTYAHVILNRIEREWKKMQSVVTVTFETKG